MGVISIKVMYQNHIKNIIFRSRKLMKIAASCNISEPWTVRITPGLQSVRSRPLIKGRSMGMTEKYINMFSIFSEYRIIVYWKENKKMAVVGYTLD